MQYTIEHEVPGRLRVRLNGVVRDEDVDPLSHVLADHPAITKVTVYPRIGSVALTYGTLEADAARGRVLDFLDTLESSQLDAARSDYTFALATRTHDLVLDIALLAGGFIARRILLPAPLAMIYAIWQYRRFLCAALASLWSGKLDVPTLDAVVMLTGDNRQSAERIAREAGITDWQADMLPEDKHRYVKELRRRGRRVVMVGDGINDSPALREANVGVAMAAGTAIAREVADVTLSHSDLSSLVQLRKLSMGLIDRFDSSFRTIMLWNSALLALGIGGIITPQTSSLLHNASTFALGARATRSYLMNS